MLIGALISSYLIPSFTRKWQDHQKALEVRSDLASQIAGSATSAIMRSEAVHLQHKPTAAEQNAWLGWRIRSAAVQARLRAYLSDSTLAREWTGFMQEVEAFHLASKNPASDPSALGCVHTALLLSSAAARRVEDAARREAGKDIPRLRKPRRFACLSPLPIQRGLRRFRDPFDYEYYLVEDELSARRTELIAQVLGAHVSAF